MARGRPVRLQRPRQGGQFDGEGSPEPHPEGEMASQGPGPSRASSPSLPEISGRPLRIITDPHTNADKAWARARETMIATLQDEVTRARAAE
jgi:hypothetical protein